MSRPPYWVSRVPVLSTSHLTRDTLDWLQRLAGDHPFGTVASYPEGVFLYLRCRDLADLPADIQALQYWVSRRRFGWIRLDADGDVVKGLPTFAW